MKIFLSLFVSVLMASLTGCSTFKQVGKPITIGDTTYHSLLQEHVNPVGNDVTTLHLVKTGPQRYVVQRPVAQQFGQQPLPPQGYAPQHQEQPLNPVMLSDGGPGCASQNAPVAPQQGQALPQSNYPQPTAYNPPVQVAQPVQPVYEQVVETYSETSVVNSNNASSGGVVKSIAPALIAGGSYVAGQSHRRPDKTNVQMSGGNANSNGGSSHAGSNSGSASSSGSSSSSGANAAAGSGGNGALVEVMH